MMLRKTLLTLGVTLALAAPALADTYIVDRPIPRRRFRFATS